MMGRVPKQLSLIRLVKLLLLLGAVLYFFLCMAMAFLQRSLLYFPTIYTPAQLDQMAAAAGLGRWTNSAGEYIGLKRLSLRQPADGSILITYGNGGTSVGCAHYADAIQSVASMDVFILEYPGYADRPGKPSQKGLFDAAEEAFQMLPTNRPVYLIGESLGAGVASFLAGTHPAKIAGTLLISPFDRLASVARFHYPFLPIGLLLVDKFPSEDYLRHYHGPVGIVVDGRDTVVPEKFGRRLFDSYAGPKRLWYFPEGHHIDITDPPEKFWGEVVDFWKTHQPSLPSK
jgi:uncharacterized protein